MAPARQVHRHVLADPLSPLPGATDQDATAAGGRHLASQPAPTRAVHHALVRRRLVTGAHAESEAPVECDPTSRDIVDASPVGTLSLPMLRCAFRTVRSGNATRLSVRGATIVSLVVVGLTTVAGGSPSASAVGANPGPASGLTCSTAPGTWPMFQGDPSHSGDACSSIDPSNLATLTPTWFVSTKGAVTATPTVVDGTVFVGDSTGTFYAIDQATGKSTWTFNTAAAQSCFLDASNPHTDMHATYDGQIPGSASVSVVDGTSTLFVPAGGSIFALDAHTGSCLWAQDTDPANPASGVEVESSPVVDTATTPPEVIVGNDDNGTPGIAVTGLMAFNAATGALLWKYEPERDITLLPSEFGGSDALTLSCGDGSADPTYCTSTNIPDLAPNSPNYADACGDIWSSPALDASFVDPAGDNAFSGSGSEPSGWYAKQITNSGQASTDGLVVFGTGNCAANPTPETALAHGDYIDNQTVFALDPVTGVRVWNRVEPYNIYDNNPNEPIGADDDFGSSPVLAQVPSPSVPSAACSGVGGSTGLAIEASKSGYAYGLCEASGAIVWANQVAQPGQADQEQAALDSIGGFIASPSLGDTNGRATAYFASGIPLPFSNDGLREPGGGDTNVSSCPGAVLSALPLLPVCPDLSLATSPTRLLPLTAVDAATGAVDWSAAAVPTYGSTSFTNGIVFSPQTLGLNVTAYDASTGTPLRTFPLGAAPSSAAVIVGNGIYFGAGTAFDTLDGQIVPPQTTGIWAFTTGIKLPSAWLTSSRRRYRHEGDE